MQKYVLIFVRFAGAILLVTKDRPSWQKGKKNFPGGKVDKGETWLSAAQRELKEETGMEGEEWRECGEIQFSTGTVKIFECVPKNPNMLVENSDPTEPVAWFPMKGILNRSDLIPNLRILIPILYVGVTHVTVSDTKKGTLVNIRPLSEEETIV